MILLAVPWERYSKEIKCVSTDTYYLVVPRVIHAKSYHLYNLNTNHNIYEMSQNEIEGADNIYLVPITFSCLCEKKMVEYGLYTNSLF